MLGNIGGEVGKMLKTLDKDKKMFDGLLKEAKGDKEIESLMKSMQKLMGDKKKLLQDVEKAVKKKK